MKLSDTNSSTDACSSTVSSETVSVAAADAAGNCGSSNDKEVQYVQVEDVDENDNKKRKVDDIWLRVQNMVLKQSDKAILLKDELKDKIINAAQ